MTPFSGVTRWLEPWFGAYALTGLLVNGIVPLLIPLTTDKRGPAVTGLVVASFFVGQLSAPVVGAIADRSGRQRQVSLGSFPVMALAAVGFGLADGPAQWMLAAVVAGSAAGAAQTTGSVFIVEGHPKPEWAMRAAELTSDGEGSAMGLFNSAVAMGAIVGAVVPSFLAGAFGYGSLPPLAAGVMAAGLLVGAPVLLHRTTIPRPSAPT